MGRKSFNVICPRCCDVHPCPKSWYMYTSDQWMGFICLIYCCSGSDVQAIMKLYDSEYRYKTYTTHMGIGWDFSDEAIPF